MPGNWIIYIWKLNICNYVTFCHHVASHLYCFGCVHQLAGIVENNCFCRADKRYSTFESDGTRAETRFGLSAKRTSPFKLAGGSVHSTAGSRGVRISSSNGSNAGYTMFWGRVKDYWLPTALACFPFTSPPARHRVPSGSKRAIRMLWSVLLPWSLLAKGYL